MNRKRLIGVRLWVILLSALICVAGFAAEGPNIVLILGDGVGVNDLSCYGGKDRATPHLDQLAAQGVRFTTAYGAQPFSAPSQAALLTGKCPARLHFTNALPGRADAPFQKLKQPVSEGQLPLEEITLAESLHDASYKTAFFGKWNLGGVGFGAKEQGFEVVDAAQGPDLAAQAEKFMEAHRGAAFFLCLSDLAKSVDESVGRVVKKLDALGLLERTLLIFAGDARGLSEDGLRVPLILRWPGKVKAGSVIDSPIILTDLMPTLLEAAGLDPAKTVGPLDGASLVKLVGGGELWPRSLYWHLPHYSHLPHGPAGAVRDGDWKLTETFEDGRYTLHNVVIDPAQKMDLSRVEPTRTAELLTKLAVWRKSIGAQQCVPNPAYNPALSEKVSNLPARVTAPTGDIRLHAKDAQVHGTNARYEPQPYKNTIGFWTKPEDWASWEFDITKPGKYEVEVMQGCKGGGSEVAVEVGGQTLTFTVENTGHFQHFIHRTIGVVALSRGKQTLALKPKTKQGAAVLDLRMVRLLPAGP